MKIKYLDSETDKVLSATFKIEGVLADLAYDASKKRNMVSITGTIIGTSRNRHIEDITDFKVI